MARTAPTLVALAAYRDPPTDVLATGWPPTAPLPARRSGWALRAARIVLTSALEVVCLLVAAAVIATPIVVGLALAAGTLLGYLHPLVVFVGGGVVVGGGLLARAAGTSRQ